MTQPELETLAQTLESSEQYRVIRRYKKPDRYAADPDDLSIKRIGLFLDVETTGLDPQNDKIIELAMVRFEFSSDGQIYRILDEYDELQDPGEPIPSTVVELTGITDDMVRDKHIERTEVDALVDPVAVVIAHNARFDRRFVERYFNVFENKAWACSATQIPWQQEGLGSSKLDYLAYRYGYFFDGHRAVNDCLAGLHLLAQTLPREQTPALRALLDTARSRTRRVWALGSPFESKDALKARGYRWSSGEDGRHRSWYIEVEEDQCEAELVFLRQEIPGGDDFPIDTISAFNRFSDRGGRRV